MLHPLGDKVLVKPIPLDDVTEGGLILPTQSKDRPLRGTVVSTGPGARMNDGTIAPVSVKAGQVVLFGKYSGAEIPFGKDTLLMLCEPDILAVDDAPVPRRVDCGD